MIKINTYSLIFTVNTVIGDQTSTQHASPEKPLLHLAIFTRLIRVRHNADPQTTTQIHKLHCMNNRSRFVNRIALPSCTYHKSWLTQIRSLLCFTQQVTRAQTMTSYTNTGAHSPNNANSTTDQRNSQFMHFHEPYYKFIVSIRN